MGVKAYLVCEGLDTLCAVYVNGKKVGESINMHVAYEFDVTSVLNDGKNVIRIDFEPVNPFIKAKHAKEQFLLVGMLWWTNNLDEQNHITFELLVDGRVVASGSEVFTQHKYYNYQSPNLKVRVEGEEIVVTSNAYAKYVEVYSESEDFILEDNFFDMEKGEKCIKIVEGSPKNLSVRSVYDIR